MIVVNVKQGTQEWLDARVGIITASHMSEIITPKTRKPSASMTKCAYRILVEEIMGRSVNDASSGFMQRGTEMEDEARAWYAYDQQVEVQRVGLVLRDDGKVGCSPDGLIGDHGGIEIKCPSAVVHMGFLLGDTSDNEYFSQIQANLWLCERAWWDFVSYCPGLPPVLVRFRRDEEFIAAMSACVDTLLERLDGYRVMLDELGALPPLEHSEEEAA